MILGITGHRPPTLKIPYETPSPGYEKLYKAVVNKFNELSPSKIISGLAQGSDQIACWVAIELNIPYIAALAGEGQESLWPDDAKRKFYHLLNQAEKVVKVSQEKVSNKAYFNRDKWIVDFSDNLLGIWNGQETGGTYYTIKYAKTKQNYQIHILNPHEIICGE